MSKALLEEHINLLIANQIEFQLPVNHEFVYRFLGCFETIPRSTIKLLKLEQDKNPSQDIFVKSKKISFRLTDSLELLTQLEDIRTLKKVTKDKIRFIVVLNQTQMLVQDTKKMFQIIFDIAELPMQYEIFLPLIGIDSVSAEMEHETDLKASERMGKFYSDIKAHNSIATDTQTHDLNLFLTRILFCMFAEDTGIFPKDSFENVIKMTQTDGSDIPDTLTRLFSILNTKIVERPDNLIQSLSVFPYANGGLFNNTIAIPRFTQQARQSLIRSCELKWDEINPDIFGAMVQAVLRTDVNNDNTEHFTSVPNIMKVIRPLLLNELDRELENAKNDKELDQLLTRISRIKFFDPAVGCANFLIITYKEIRRLEIKILSRISNQSQIHNTSIRLDNFYGIEINDFSAEVAKISMLIAQHQMNKEFEEQFSHLESILPLRDSCVIVHGNAAQLDWTTVCPRNESNEIYIIGNPPFGGSRKQDTSQKDDLKKVFKGKDYKSLDYVSLWYYLGAEYIRGFNAKCALVSTNSIVQGEQVALLWPRVLGDDIEINFAYQSFKWKNSARANAGVTCVIIGLANKSQSTKYIFNGLESANTHQVVAINPYLMNGETIFVHSRTTPLSQFPEMNFGNMPNDGGNLLLTFEEKEKLIAKNPEISRYIKRALGGADFLRDLERYCLWIEDPVEVENITEIVEIINKVKKYRLKSEREVTKKLANFSYRFGEVRHQNKQSIIIPATTSENRTYIPMDFRDNNTIILNSAQAIYTDNISIFGIISSRMHMVWVRAVGGRLKTDLRYSKNVIYNTFPFPPISDDYRETITRIVFDIIGIRERYFTWTLADMYNPDRMPEDLRQRHSDLDSAIDRCYIDNLRLGKSYFIDDSDRLEMLFGLYQKMIHAEQEAQYANSMIELSSKAPKKPKAKKLVVEL